MQGHPGKLIESPLPVGEMLQRAKAGDPGCQYRAAIRYLQGQGVRKNLRQALKWLEKAASQGDIDALLELGGIHHDGEIAVQDDEKACRYYRRAAEAGSAAGQFMYGSFLMKGEGIGADPVEALELLDLAAAQGYQEALEVQNYFAEFISYDPRKGKYGPSSIDHEFPVRRRTLLLMEHLGRPCYQAMSRDLSEYLQMHPQSAEVALEDIVTLLDAALGRGEPIVAFSGGKPVLAAENPPSAEVAKLPQR